MKKTFMVPCVVMVARSSHAVLLRNRGRDHHFLSQMSSLDSRGLASSNSLPTEDDFIVSDPSDDECLDACEVAYAYVTEAFAADTLDAAGAAAAEAGGDEELAKKTAQWWAGTYKCAFITMDNEEYVWNQRYLDDEKDAPASACFVDVCCIDSTLESDACCTPNPVNIATLALLLVGFALVVLVLAVATPLGSSCLPQREGGGMGAIDITGLSVPEEYITLNGRKAGRLGALLLVVELASCCGCFALGTVALAAINVAGTLVAFLFSLPSCCGIAGGWTTTYSTKDAEGLRYLAIAALASLLGRILLVAILAGAIAATGDSTGIFEYPRGALSLVLTVSAAFLLVSAFGVYCGFKGHLEEVGAVNEERWKFDRRVVENVEHQKGSNKSVAVSREITIKNQPRQKISVGTGNPL